VAGKSGLKELDKKTENNSIELAFLFAFM